MYARASRAPFQPSCRAYWLFVCAHRIVSGRARGGRTFTGERGKGLAVMRTATLEGNGLELSPEIAARVEALRQRPGADFESADDAQPMERDDVRNVRRLNYAEQSLLARMEEASPELFAKLSEAADALWGGWPADDFRWELTPHELKKVREMPARERRKYRVGKTRGNKRRSIAS